MQGMFSELYFLIKFLINVEYITQLVRGWNCI